MNIISVKNISKKYGARVVLDDVCFDIKSGEIFGLLGSNGAGKSTITNIMLGLERQSSGRIIFFEGKKKDFKDSLSLVPQEVSFYKDFTVQRNMHFFGSIYNIKKDLVKKRTDFLLKWLSLEDFRKMKASRLSGGYQRLLNIAISLINDPEIIFLDEPTVGLDPKMRKMFWDKIEELNRSGKTIIITTHYMDEAENLCDRIVLMKKGELIKIGEPIELIKQFGGIKVMVLRIENGLEEKDFLKIKEIIGHQGVLLEGEDLFVPMEQSHGLEKTLAIIQWLMDKGYNITSSIIKEPDLEDVFLNLTGERMMEKRS